MAKNSNQEPKTVADSSGFPLQIGLINTINQSSEWRVVVQEHPWRSKDDSSNGFIDIVAMKSAFQNVVTTMVIECKRVRGASWVFLVPEIPPPQKGSAVIWESIWNNGELYKDGWKDGIVYPISYESMYCAIPGHEQGRRTLLERTAVELSESVEALAKQVAEIDIKNNFVSNGRKIYFYVPVIITTAHLITASFDPAHITLEDGNIPDGTPFIEVPYIRFRKSLSLFGQNSTTGDLQNLYRANERTIFVVNAQNVSDFLNQFAFD